MTLQEFEAGLKAAVPETYETAAPKGLTRYVVWHAYGFQHLPGDDRNQIDIPKVQLDILYQKFADTIVDDVTGALWLMDLPYQIMSDGYDPDYAMRRCIIQLVVV